MLIVAGVVGFAVLILQITAPPAARRPRFRSEAAVLSPPREAPPPYRSVSGWPVRRDT